MLGFDILFVHILRTSGQFQYASCFNGQMGIDTLQNVYVPLRVSTTFRSSHVFSRVSSIRKNYGNLESEKLL